MATTSLVGLAARAWGFPGRETMRGCEVGDLRSWKWRVESQEADTRMPVEVEEGTS